MAKTSLPAPPASFEKALAELEAIVQTMETTQPPLEESLAAYERGTLLLKYCQSALDAAEQKLQILEGNELRDMTPTPRHSAD